jgi:hypothetical protein
MDKTLSIEIPVAWHFIRNVKRLVEENLAEFPESLRYATSMVAAELIGNAIKYGESTPDAPHATFSMQVSDRQILIEVRNGVNSLERVREVTQRVAQMAASPNKEDVYLERLQELLSGSSRGSQLGLYRIGYEGEFDLECTYTGSILSVRATRGLS